MGSPEVPKATKSKTIYLIRHAESEENRKLASLKRCFTQLGAFSLPSKDDVTASAGLLRVYAQIDSDVSEMGKSQIEQVAKQLAKDDFIQKSGIQLVAHSPLKRARETSRGMLDCAKEGDKEIAKAPGVGRVLELDLIIEKTPQEWIPGNYKSFTDRIASFEAWLREQPEDDIAIVGHSQYFKAMLGLSFKFGNCDVWQVQFVVSPLEEEAAGNEVNEEINTEPETVVDNDTPEGTPDNSYTLSRGWKELKRLYTFSEEY